MLSFLVTDPSIQKDKLMKICLVHDLAESIVGDITPHCGVSKEEKKRLELVRHSFVFLFSFEKKVFLECSKRYNKQYWT